jgi:hypothetical protein
MRDPELSPYEETEPFNALRDLRAVALAQEAENERLREALREIADLPEAVDEGPSERRWAVIGYSAVRLARDALAATERTDQP